MAHKTKSIANRLKNKTLAENRFSATILLAFALIFAVIGGYIILHSKAAVTCDLNATTSNFASQVSAASAGQTICLASGNYGTFAGTNKAITIAAASGATPQMQINFGSGDSNFTLDGMTGMGGNITGGSNFTVKNSSFTSPTSVSGTMGVVFDHDDFLWNSVGTCCKITGMNFSGSITSPAFTLQNSTIMNGESDGVRVADNPLGFLILNNHFDNLCDIGSNHTDNIQFYGSNMTQVRIAGNYFHTDSSCATQAVASYDGGTNGVIIENNVIDTSRTWGIELFKDHNSIVRHNTLPYHASGCNAGICGYIDLNTKDSPGSGTQIYDNVTTGVSFENGSTGSAYANTDAHTVSYVGGASPTTHDGFLLTPSSPGHLAGSDGNDTGVYALGTTLPPPPSDIITPTVSVTTPSAGATVSGTGVTLSANASDNVRVVGVQFKVDGANVGYEDTSSPYSITWDSRFVLNGIRTITAVARDAAGNTTTSSAVSVTASNSVSCKQSSTAWQNNSIASQTGSFNFDYDTTPLFDGMDSITGLSSGSATAYANLAAAVRFNTGGTIDARNGANYAATTSVSYTAGTSYHIRLAVNITNHTYTITVTPAGGSATVIGTDYAFRTEQAGITSINNWAIYALTGNHNVCGANINTGSNPPPTATLTANPTSISSGSSSTLTWSSTNATSCTASNGWSGTKATSGTQSVSPTATTTYTITCTGAGGTSPASSATVTVTTTTKVGDFNNDNAVNIFDLSILLSNYGKTAAQSSNPLCDMNTDGTINIFDLSILLSHYGT